jgi:cytochrome c556
MKYVIAFVLGITIISSAVLAAPKAEDKIKFRQSGMMFMRWNMGTIKKQVIKNPQTYNKEQVAAAARVIAAIANSGMGALFSPDTVDGTGWKKTRIKPEYFDEPDKVRKYASDFNREAKELARVADSGDVDMIKTQFNKLFKACKACHKQYRAK